MMKPVPVSEQPALVERLMKACGGAYSPQTRRKYFITARQWAYRAYLHELMWGGAPRAALARALLAGQLWHFDVNDGDWLKHDVDIGVGLVNALDWLKVLVLLRSHGYNGPFNLDYKPPRTTSNHGVFAVTFPSAVDRFIRLWEMAGEVLEDPVLRAAIAALKAGAGVKADGDAAGIFQANKDLLTLHELIAHRMVQILPGLHRGRTYSI
jgi:xylose isomerase